MASTFRYSHSEESLESRTIATDDTYTLTPQEFESRMDNNHFATTFWDPPGVQYATRTLGPDRMVLGTDYPIRENIMKEMTDTIDELDVSERERGQICSENAVELFDV